MEIVRYNGYGIVEINSEDTTIGMEEIVFGHTNPRARYKHHGKWFRQGKWSKRSRNTQGSPCNDILRSRK